MNYAVLVHGLWMIRQGQHCHLLAVGPCANYDILKAATHQAPTVSPAWCLAVGPGGFTKWCI